jgi:hypothetical protein
LKSHLEPVEVTAPKQIYRVARSGQVERFSRIDPSEAALASSGNRFDVLGGGVLYGASTPSGCYAETLARFRLSAGMRQKVEEMDADGSRMACGGVPADWRARRTRATLSMRDPLPFLDVEHPATHEYLTSQMASELAALGLSVLDVAAVRGPNRHVTRAIASWAYAATNDDDELRYSGIRYVSKLGDWECWAIFDGTPVEVDEIQVITTSDPHLEEVSNLYGLRLF